MCYKHEGMCGPMCGGKESYCTSTPTDTTKIKREGEVEQEENREKGRCHIWSTQGTISGEASSRAVTPPH